MYTDRRTVCVVQMDSTECAHKLAELITCVICESNTSEKLTKLTPVGLQSLRSSSEAGNRVDICAYLDSSPPPTVYVQVSCRKAFTRLRHVKKLKFEAEPEPEFRSLPSATGSFAWKSMCFLCGSHAIDSVDIRHVCTLEIGRNVILKCDDRADSWSYEIRSRLKSCNDLVAEEAIYHKSCHSRFMNGLCLSAASCSGRHECKSARKAFDSMCFKLETCCERDLYTLEDLHALMCACLERDTDSQQKMHIQSCI